MFNVVFGVFWFNCVLFTLRVAFVLSCENVFLILACSSLS